MRGLYVLLQFADMLVEARQRLAELFLVRLQLGPLRRLLIFRLCAAAVGIGWHRRLRVFTARLHREQAAAYRKRTRQTHISEEITPERKRSWTHGRHPLRNRLPEYARFPTTFRRCQRLSRFHANTCSRSVSKLFVMRSASTLVSA